MIIMEFIQNNQDYNIQQINKYSAKFNLNNEIIKLLFSRGIDDEDKIYNFLNPSINNFYNPFLLNDMAEVVKKINSAIDENKQIVILGDYDTDGISASAILYKYFRSRNAKVEIFLPNRFVDGYGLNNDTIDKIQELYHPDLIVTVDCGISNYKEVDYCFSKGIDIIVTDHHDIPDIVPNTLIINPKLPNQGYPFKELCGAGVALKLVQAMAGLQEALKYTTIASLATVADIVPLVDENRAIVYHGLNNQEDGLPLGLKKLCKKTKIDLPIMAQDIAYKLAPKINASGRMGDAKVSFVLYVSDNEKEIQKYIAQLLELNENRLNSTNKIAEEAMQQMIGKDITKIGMIVLHNRSWESGVLGIICAKLVEKFNKPVCILSEVDGEYKGSCRSIPGINIYEVLSSVQDILIRFGGHNQAGGLSLYEEHIDEFTARVNEFVLTKYDKSIFLPSKTYDIDANKVKVNMDFLQQLNRLEPFGFGNERPTFKLASSNCNVVRLPKHPNHLKVKVNNVEIMCYSSGDMFYNISSNCIKEFLVDINIEKFGKITRIAGKLKAFNYGKLNGALRKEVICANYLNQLHYLNVKDSTNLNVVNIDRITLHEKINDLLNNSPIGTLLIANTYASYDKACKEFPQIKNFELYQINHSLGENTLILAPNSDINFANYSNIILLDAPLTRGYVSYISNNNNFVYVADSAFDLTLLNNLSCERKIFAIYHNIIRDYCAKNISSLDLPNCFKNIKKLNPQNTHLSYDQFYFVLQVFSELGIMEVVGGDIKYNANISSKLNNSTIYNFIDLLLKVKRGD